MAMNIKLLVLALMTLDFVEVNSAEATCKVTPNGRTIDWDRLSVSGKWYQVLNTQNGETTSGSCTLIKVKKHNPGRSSVLFNLQEVRSPGHKITVYNSWLPAIKKKTPIKKSNRVLSAIISTMKIDTRSDINLQLEINSHGVPPEHFVTDYESYFIGKMCWNNEVYIWAYIKEQDPVTSKIVDLFHQIASMPGSPPVTFAACDEVQDFAYE